MTPFKRPMKAASLLDPKTETTDENIYAALLKLKMPKLVSIKKDGIRAERLNTGTQPNLLSYTLKPIPNLQIRRYASENLSSGLDMELYNPSLSFQEIVSRVMSESHDDWFSIQYHVIDWINFTLPYEKRCDLIRDALGLMPSSVLKFEYPTLVRTAAELLALFLKSEENGEEGICFRSPDSPYKQGRSTLREEYLIKLCRWVRFEARITGFEEQMLNTNSPDRNGLGMVDRSSSAAGLVGKGTLGALWVEDDKGRKWKVGTGVGLDDRLRQHIWDNKTKYIGRRITVKYKPHGEKDKPRHPIFCGFREEGY